MTQLPASLWLEVVVLSRANPRSILGDHTVFALVSDIESRLLGGRFHSEYLIHLTLLRERPF
jgi:hypothetical protein